MGVGPYHNKIRIDLALRGHHRGRLTTADAQCRTMLVDGDTGPLCRARQTQRIIQRMQVAALALVEGSGISIGHYTFTQRITLQPAQRLIAIVAGHARLKLA